MQRFIDQTTGTLIINRNIRVDRATRPQDIVFLFGPGQVQLRDMENGWTWYIVDKVSGDAPVSNILFIFQGNTLNQINFLLSNLPVKSASWSEWSEKNELAVQKYLDNKLTECLGADRDFIWGSISACYDRKGGASSIVMQYS